MYNIKAKKGNVDLGKFNLDSIIQPANEEALSIAQHNKRVIGLFSDLVDDYITKVNSHLRELGLDEFVNQNRNIRKDFVCTRHNVCTAEYEMGHGRASILLKFTSGNAIGERCSTDFKGIVLVIKNWQNDFLREEFELTSVADILEKGEQVVKFFIIDKGVKDDTQKRKLIEDTLKY
jgi:hypothetical protein